MTLTAADLDRIDVALSFLGDRLERDHPLGPLTTYRVGGPARRFVEVLDPGELVRIGSSLAPLATLRGDDVLVVGRGSNMLVADRGADALVLQLGEAFTDVRILGDKVSAGGATLLPVLARRTVSAGLSGFEWAVGVPGTLGGAVRMNAGGHGSDIAASLVGVRVIDVLTGEDVRMEAAALELGYRSSRLRRSEVVVEAQLQLRVAEDPAEREALLGEIVRWRREHQPGGQNAGSVFTNPAGDSAGRLIDESGARGLRIGSAAVSDKHANFIQADAAGSADDIARVMVSVRRLVARRSGVQLHPETVLVGFTDDVLADLTAPIPTGDDS
ncbi:MAG: UDP-N-acetylmuramate dehydrogenase [Microthrixaceae bacterium]